MDSSGTNGFRFVRRIAAIEITITFPIGMYTLSRITLEFNGCTSNFYNLQISRSIKISK